MPDFNLSPQEAHRLAGHNGERRSPSTGLPILSTEPLTSAERQQLERLARLMRTGAELIETAVVVGRVDIALEALHRLDVTDLVAQVTVQLGRNR